MCTLVHEEHAVPTAWHDDEGRVCRARVSARRCDGCEPVGVASKEHHRNIEIRERVRRVLFWRCEARERTARTSTRVVCAQERVEGAPLDRGVDGARREPAEEPVTLIGSGERGSVPMGVWRASAADVGEQRDELSRVLATRRIEVSDPAEEVGRGQPRDDGMLWLFEAVREPVEKTRDGSFSNRARIPIEARLSEHHDDGENRVVGRRRDRRAGAQGLGERTHTGVVERTHRVGCEAEATNVVEEPIGEGRVDDECVRVLRMVQAVGKCERAAVRGADDGDALCTERASHSVDIRCQRAQRDVHAQRAFVRTHCALVDECAPDARSLFSRCASDRVICTRHGLAGREPLRRTHAAEIDRSDVVAPIERLDEGHDDRVRRLKAAVGPTDVEEQKAANLRAIGSARVERRDADLFPIGRIGIERRVDETAAHARFCVEALGVDVERVRERRRVHHECMHHTGRHERSRRCRDGHDDDEEGEWPTESHTRSIAHAPCLTLHTRRALFAVMETTTPRAFATPAALETWLKKNHAVERELWVQIYKKDSGKRSVTWNDCVVASLIWGWIDGQKKSLDDVSFLQRLTPRRAKSNWSKKNREHAERLIIEGRMQPSGLAHVDAARADGRWEQAYSGSAEMVIPADFLAALEDVPAAKAFFATLNRANLFAIYHRIETAKQAKTRAARVERIIAQLARSERFH